MRLLTLSVLSAAMLAPALPVLADGDALKRVQASRVVFDTGVAERDALLVMAAAKLRRGVGLGPTDRAPDGGAGDGGTGLLNANQMLDVARDFAVGDPTLLGLIEDVAAESTKGVTGGPVYNIATLAAKQSDIYGGVPFATGAYAEIYVEAKDSSDLNLIIRDAQNRLVCSDTDISAIAYCGWQPREDGTFSITVQNMSGRTVQYSLITN